ncbi:MAG: uracil-DNA glycosylase [Gammaproteobacteria bacterium]|nr:uracil-DNA glycosylase [Gammaproteobacteria bacterium]
MTRLALKAIDPSWTSLLESALQQVDPIYLDSLSRETHWLPGPDKIFNAFSIPLWNIKRILVGESPYPRAQSANGYAFWDGAAGEIWTDENKLSKTVNRATSLRNIMKMLLKAEGGKPKHCVQTLSELFQNLLNHGFLLLNASLVLHPTRKVQEDAKQWRNFIQVILNGVYEVNPNVELVLFGKIAQQILPLLKYPFKIIQAEHPYNLSFIENPLVLDYFRPLHILKVGQSLNIDKFQQPSYQSL